MLITKVQENLARKAALQPNSRVENLYNVITQLEVLETAFEGVAENAGANTAGIDGLTIKNVNRSKLVAELADELWRKTYTPQPVRRVSIAKANGRFISSGIPIIRDRVVQEAIRLLLEPFMEGRFLNCAVGYRPSRRAMDAIHTMTLLGNNQVKMWWIIVGSIEACFDDIPHKKFLGVLKQHVDDKQLIELIRKFFRAGIYEDDKVSTPNRGISHCGVIAPFLTNIYLHEMDKYWWEKYGGLTEGQKSYRRAKGLGNVQYIRYGDEFVILMNGNKHFAYQLQEEFNTFLATLGLKLAFVQTSVRHVNDGFDFLGFHIKRVYSQQSAKHIMLVNPSSDNIQRFKERIQDMTSRSRTGDDPVNKIRAINQVVSVWADYYRCGNASDAFNSLSSFVHMRFYYWLKAKHSNVSAKGSIGKYVVRKYLRPVTIKRKTFKTWFISKKVFIRPMWLTKIRRYRINRPKSGNPYLEDGDFSHKVPEDNPLPSTFWQGNTSQSAYAVARLDKLRMVNYQCEACGSRVSLEAHHIVFQSDNGKHSVSNLKILCAVCHQTLHSGKQR